MEIVGNWSGYGCTRKVQYAGRSTIIPNSHRPLAEGESLLRGLGLVTGTTGLSVGTVVVVENLSNRFCLRSRYSSSLRNFVSLVKINKHKPISIPT